MRKTMKSLSQGS